jgi:4-hydroxy-2-oxoheptanedioate aldolase
LSLGLPARGDVDEPTHMRAVETVLTACKRHGVPIGIHTSSLEWSRRRLEAGFDFVTIGSDAGFIMQGAAAALSQMRGVKAKEREPTGY